MRKRILFILVLLLMSINVSYSYKAYNSSLSNFSLDSNSWCVNLRTDFKVYNSTQFELKKSTGFRTCLVNETPKRVDCLIFQNLTPDVKIYSGPFDSFPILFDEKLESPGEFELVFPKESPYLVEITGLPQFNDFHDTIGILTCKNANISSSYINYSTSSFSGLKNITFDYGSGIKIGLVNSSLEKNDFFVSVLTNNLLGDLPKVNDSIKIFSIEGNASAINFNDLDVVISFEKLRNNSKIEVYKINTRYGAWYSFNSYSYIENSSNISISEFGTFYVKEIFVSIPNLTNTNLTSTALTTGEVKVEGKKVGVSLSNFTLGPDNSLIYLSIFFILFVIVIYLILKYLKFFSSKLQVETHSTSLLNSYGQIYSSTKTYVSKHKTKFSKESLRTALEKSNVPSDLIDRVFFEEY